MLCLGMAGAAAQPSEDTAVIQVSVVLDSDPPTGTVSINGGDAWTTSLGATLTLNASDTQTGVAQMRFSNDDASWSAWEPYATTKSWTLASGEDGSRSVYVQFMDGVGNPNTNTAISDTILYDVNPPTGSVSINSGAAWTNDPAATLTITASDAATGVAEMRISNDAVFLGPWEAFAASKPWALPPGEGSKTVWLQLKDNAGHETTAEITADIGLDTTPPVSFTPVADPVTCTNGEIQVTFETTDALSGIGRYEVAVDDETYATATSPYAADAAMLSDGAHTVHVKAFDQAGNSVGPYGVSIYADGQPPSILLNGLAYISLPCGSEYQDEGATASDMCAGDLTSSVEVSGIVDTSTPGEYTIMYTVSDPGGNAAEPVFRTVEVTGPCNEGEGVSEGAVEGMIEGQEEGILEGENEGTVEGSLEGEGQIEGEGVEEGEGQLEGEGAEEGQIEGYPEGELEGLPEGNVEGQLEGEGMPTEGSPEEGTAEGLLEGQSEGTVEGSVEGRPEGSIEGELEGEGVEEGQIEGEEGEGVEEGQLEGEGAVTGIHSADQDANYSISLSELLRIIQFYNSGGLHCQPGSEDGYAPGSGGDTSCGAHSSDYTPHDWRISLSELLRLIQFYNSRGYHACENGEDGFCPGSAGAE